MTANSAFSIFKEKYASNIRFWIVLFFLLRLYGITDPPLEIAHNWRQVTGDMVARNFYETDSNILYPRLDIGGEKTGITGTEFSVLNYAMYLLSLVFGFHDWFGRLINLIVSSFGVLYFYKLIKLKFDAKFAFHAAFILLTSMWLMFSRKTMPDTFSTSLVIIGLYHAFNYFGNSKLSSALCYFMFSLLGVLSKIPVAYLLVILCFPIFDKEIVLKKKMMIISLSLTMCLPVVWWYFYWVPFLIEKFNFYYYYMGTTFTKGLHDIVNNLAPTLEKFYFDALKFSGFATCLAGLIIAFVKRDKRVLLLILACSIAFFVFMLKAGFNFYHHSYYIVPFVPVMSLLVAYALVRIEKKGLRIFLLLLITGESIANQQHDFRIPVPEEYKLSLMEIADKNAAPGDLIAINGDHNPQLMYFTHRKGWSLNSSKTSDLVFMKGLADLGCKYLFLDKQDKEFIAPSEDELFTKKYEDEHFVVYKLNKN